MKEKARSPHYSNTLFESEKFLMLRMWKNKKIIATSKIKKEKSTTLKRTRQAGGVAGSFQLTLEYSDVHHKVI